MADLKAKLRNTGTLMAKQSVAGGGKGATDWAHLKDKPFETLGDDFTVDNGELQITEGVIPAVSATATLSSGTEIGSVTVDGVTTTFYAPEDSSVEIDNKSLIEVDGVIQEAVPVYTEHIDEVRQVTRAASIQRGIIWTNKFYANPYTDYTNPVDVTIRYWYTGINGDESGDTIIGQWSAVDLTDTSAIYTDESGKRWTIYTEVEESDHPILNYIAFNCLDELENGYYHFDYEIPAMSIYGYEANREQQGYENKWATHGYSEALNGIVDYPNVDEIYFKYLIQQGYSTYEQVDVVANNVDISQPIIITDTNNVEWKITCTRDTNNLNAVLITLEALSDLPADFRDLEYMSIDDSYGNIFLKFQARVTDTVIHQVPAEYIPIDNYTIQNVDGKLVAQSSSGVSNVEYEDLTGGQGQQIGALRVTNEQGVGETYIYAPSSSEWSTIAGKPFETVGEGLEVSSGAIKEKVPVYTETIDEMPAGLQITGWQDVDGIGDDADVQININGTDITLNTDTDAYTVSAKINNHIYSGSWTASTDLGHAYGGYTWTIPELSANPTCEFYLENIGSGDYNVYIYLNGVNCSNVEWLIITPNNAGDVIENYRDAGIFNHNVSWSYGQQSSTTVHQLPAQYVPVDNDTIINDNGVLKAAGGGSVEIDNKSIIKNADGELSTVIGGGYETYTFSESDLPSGGLSLDANVFYYYNGNINGYLYYNSSDNSALDAILSRSYKEGDSITITTTIGSVTQSATLYYSEDLGSSYYNARGFMIEGGIAGAYNIPQALIYTERVYSGSYAGCGIVFINSSSTPTINSISGSPEYKKKVSKDWVEPNFPLDDRLFAGTNNAVKIGSDEGTADRYSLLIGNGTNNNASSYSLVIGTSSNSSAKINANNHSVAFGSPSQYGGIEAKNDSLAFGRSEGGTTITARKIIANTGSLAFGYRTGTKDIIAKSYSLAAGMATSSGNGLYAGTNGSSTKYCAIAIGTDVQATMNNSQAFGMYTLANSDNQMALGKYNVADSSAKYGLIVGNGTSNSARSNSFAVGVDSNIYIKGGVYANVTNWTDPQNNSIELALIPKAPTTAGTYSLQAVVDSDGNVTYSWV